MSDASSGVAPVSSDSPTPALPRTSRFMRFLRATVGHILTGIFRTQLVGVENIPDGGVVLAGNHQSYLDPILLWIKCPRVVHFMGKAELWQNAFYAWVLNNAGTFPIDRSTVDRTAITTATSLVNAGKQVGIFPEGTRVRGKLGDANEGAAFIAMRADVPVVPVGIVGTDRVMPEGAIVPRLPRVTISFGQPIHPSEYTEGRRKERMSRLTGDVMSGIAEEIERVGGVRA